MVLGFSAARVWSNVVAGRAMEAQPELLPSGLLPEAMGRKPGAPEAMGLVLGLAPG